MPLVRTLPPVAMLLTLLVACSGSAGSPVATGPDAMVESPPAAAPDDDANAPHALGAIVLGESHQSGASAAHAIVSVSFVPDAAAQKTCTRAVAGCELIVPCPGEKPAAPSKESSFDAGPVAISGATTPITLYPPYEVHSAADGAPFLAGAQLRVQGSGAVGAGFEKFEETFTATQFLQTSPPLAQLPRSTVWSDGPLPLTWLAGRDGISVTVSGTGGSLRCKADDTKGRFDVPREVIKTALGPAPANTVSISLARERAEIKKGQKTKGQLDNVTVQPVGWLSLTTTSVESASFQCTGNECTGAPPATSCQDCRTALCKTEFDACTADATCPMLRTCLDTCADAACRNNCFVKWPDPVAKAKNGALYKCQCINSCVTECASECK